MASSSGLVVVLLFHTIVTLSIASTMPTRKTKKLPKPEQNNIMILLEKNRNPSQHAQVTPYRSHCCL